MTKNKKAEEIAFSRCDVPERTKRFALQYVSEAYAGIKNCRECEFYNTCDRIDSVRAELRKKKKEGMKNMTEQETREKIFNIIREFNVKKRRYSTHTEPSDDDELADALIAAGMVDKSDYASMKETAVRYKAEVSKAEAREKEAEAEANRYEMLYKLQNRDMALAERRAHDAEHRAEVAGRIAKRACDIVFSQEIDSEEWDEAIFNYKKEKGIREIGITPNILYDYLKEQAEKELAEEGKDERP